MINQPHFEFRHERGTKFLSTFTFSFSSGVWKFLMEFLMRMVTLYMKIEQIQMR
ncbi:hypothetical protein CE91St28_00610 [Pyramidobacter piscolens]|nr:hypothetical protein CE91St28_00610 [Pyramidobacter piscolens]